MKEVIWFEGKSAGEWHREEHDRLIASVVDINKAMEDMANKVIPPAWEVGISIRFGEVPTQMGFTHWSRVFEYPWAIHMANLKSGHVVLDAGGGDGILQYRMAELASVVINIDLEQKMLDKAKNSPMYERHKDSILYKKGNLHNIPYPDQMFDRVVCVSVLEHIENPGKVVDECWRVLKRGGRLIVTMDVAECVRHNHTIDKRVAAQIVAKFGMTLPPDSNATKYTFDEIDPAPHEKKTVDLKVVCFYCDKE